MRHLTSKLNQLFMKPQNGLEQQGQADSVLFQFCVSQCTEVTQAKLSSKASLASISTDDITLLVTSVRGRSEEKASASERFG